jgi:hypothetical protein
LSILLLAFSFRIGVVDEQVRDGQYLSREETADQLVALNAFSGPKDEGFLLQNKGCLSFLKESSGEG